MTHQLPATCDVCNNAPAVVIVADQDQTERQVCHECWHRLDRLLSLRVVRFAAPTGTRTVP